MSWVNARDFLFLMKTKIEVNVNFDEQLGSVVERGENLYNRYLR
jgi:hypothetical protein